MALSGIYGSGEADGLITTNITVFVARFRTSTTQTYQCMARPIYNTQHLQMSLVNLLPYAISNFNVILPFNTNYNR